MTDDASLLPRISRGNRDGDQWPRHRARARKRRSRQLYDKRLRLRERRQR